MRWLGLLIVLCSFGAWADCGSDNDCKGDRICEAGRCVDSSARAQPAPKVEAVVDRNPYRVHRRIGMWTLLGAWSITAVTSLVIGDVFWPTTVLPVAGPFITYMLVASNPNARFLPGGRELLLISSGVQAALFIYMVISILAEATYVPDVVVGPGPSPIGASLSFRF